jgi:arylsulfatase A-like enzyme
VKTPSHIKNILLLSVEDLNDWIEPLGGHPQAYTPNITKLFQRSMSFKQAYAAAPACSPSRTAALFGQAPWRTGIYHNRQSWAMAYRPGQKRSIIGQAKEAGWQTIGAGKVFHTGKSGLDPADWSQYFKTPWDIFTPVSRVVSDGFLRSLDDFGAISDAAPPLYDQRNLAFMKASLTKGATKTLWAYGIYRPHLPFIVPKRFFDLIKRPIEIPRGLQGRAFDPNDDREIRDLPAAAHRVIQRRMGRMLHKTGEYEDFLHAYLASIAYADFLVGELLDHMEGNGLLENTMIVFWSDHGWQLGEKLVFRKFTLWERALRVPLAVSIPKGPTGVVAEPVSLLDIYPTLLEVIGKAAPHVLDGQNLLPLIQGGQGRGFAQSMWEIYDRKSNTGDLAASVRTGQYRLIHYPDGAMELYNHESDPYEKDNLLAGGLENLGANILSICSELIDLLPDAPGLALGPANLPDVGKMMHTKDDGKVTIN